MRTTIDLPQPLLRTLKARAGLRGETLARVVHDLIERGLRGMEPGASASRRRSALPVIVPRGGRPIQPVIRARAAALDEWDDAVRNARSS